MNIVSKSITWLARASVVLILLTGCSSDSENPVVDDTATSGQGGSAGNGPAVGSTDTGSAAAIDNVVDTPAGSYSLSLSNSNITIVEGKSASINVQVQRSNGYDRQVTLALVGQTPDQTNQINWTFSNTRLQAEQSSATITLNMEFSALPIQRQSRTLRIIGTDGSIQNDTFLTVNVEPTALPDVYLLAGQSNMVGFSEDDAKEVFAGGADEPNERIRQLNVTGNDGENFSSVGAFTSVDSIAVSGQRLTTAVDPLHDGFDTRIGGKSGTRIGLGMEFARTAIANTQATIYLVPAAWSNTGFCRKERAEFEGALGWNATQPSDPAFSGTLLHDRAIARTNLTLNETGGILRGILWHQGEADSSDLICAQRYEENMRNMVNSFRTRIQQDARGPSARGVNANVPFVVGTMSQGEEYIDLSDEKQIVDGVHRNIAQIVPHAAFVNNDDLVPPFFPCGEGDCIHFGSTSYRAMGSRYYDFLVQAGSN